MHYMSIFITDDDNLTLLMIEQDLEALDKMSNQMSTPKSTIEMSLQEINLIMENLPPTEIEELMGLSPPSTPPRSIPHLSPIITPQASPHAGTSSIVDLDTSMAPPELAETSYQASYFFDRS
jgi:hypothetical protein